MMSRQYEEGLASHASYREIEQLMEIKALCDSAALRAKRNPEIGNINRYYTAIELFGEVLDCILTPERRNVLKEKKDEYDKIMEEIYTPPSRRKKQIKTKQLLVMALEKLDEMRLLIRRMGQKPYKLFYRFLPDAGPRSAKELVERIRGEKNDVGPDREV